MKTFLKYVARDILEKYGNNLSDIAVVFPNKRAALFLCFGFCFLWSITTTGSNIPCLSLTPPETSHLYG